MLARSARFTLAAAGVAVALTSFAGPAVAAPTPSAEELQSTLTRFTDPNVPSAEKQTLMVGGDRRASNIDTMTGKLANYGTIGWGVSGVQVDGESANASVAISSPHGTMPGVPMTWEYADGSWKLSEGTACTILAMGKAAC
ncbi:hypothetical protein JK358_05760 [Nocardia sp. 2]|uniref:Low molecular weight antigen MTB12-like C-terminal domain-containing protein n=1 Tax=Nocardia acididurans TaxID=2802282 RepID=A0ABS1M120_9NOCA|nr:hypothetical protein [Nocardia acididurans]MBL1073894.1 hypothetical protein [Nocardia acididurans]